MTINYNVTGDDRKKLVQAIAEILECKPKYLGVPSCAYQVDYFTISKTGELAFDDSADSDEIERLIEALCEKGFEAEFTTEETGLTISMPKDGFTDCAIENLRRLVESKSSLIKKALGADSLSITVEDDKISFPWFEHYPTPEEISAYAKFIGRLCLMAKTLKRVTAQDKDVDNDKYAFRCFLLRLGFIGDEYKAERKLLLRDLTGSAAFKSGQKKGFSQEDLDRAKANPDTRAEINAILNGEEETPCE